MNRLAIAREKVEDALRCLDEMGPQGRQRIEAICELESVVGLLSVLIAEETARESAPKGETR